MGGEIPPGACSSRARWSVPCWRAALQPDNIVFYCGFGFLQAELVLPLRPESLLLKGD